MSTLSARGKRERKKGVIILFLTKWLNVFSMRMSAKKSMPFNFFCPYFEMQIWSINDIPITYSTHLLQGSLVEVMKPAAIPPNLHKTDIFHSEWFWMCPLIINVFAFIFLLLVSAFGMCANVMRVKPHRLQMNVLIAEQVFFFWSFNSAD